LTINVKPAPPAVVEGGLKLVIAGPGLIVKGLGGSNVTPPEVTVTRAVPGFATRSAETDAVN